MVAVAAAARVELSTMGAAEVALVAADSVAGVALVVGGDEAEEEETGETFRSKNSWGEFCARAPMAL